MQEPARSASPAPAAGSVRSFALSTALIGAVLGVLPFAWDAHFVWRLVGPLVAAVLAGRAAVLLWRQVFSTDPRHLSPTG